MFSSEFILAGDHPENWRAAYHTLACGSVIVLKARHVGDNPRTGRQPKNRAPDPKTGRRTLLSSGEHRYPPAKTVILRRKPKDLARTEEPGEDRYPPAKAVILSER